MEAKDIYTESFYPSSTKQTHTKTDTNTKKHIETDTNNIQTHKRKSHPKCKRFKPGS